ERVGIELVADAPDGDDELGVAVILLDALAQPPHVDVDGPWLDVHLGSPYEVEELETIVHPMRVSHEELEELELTQGEPELVAVEERLVGVEVQTEPPPLEHLVELPGLLGVAAPENRPDARDQLAGAERPGHVVIGAELDPEHPADLPG